MIGKIILRTGVEPTDREITFKNDKIATKEKGITTSRGIFNWTTVTGGPLDTVQGIIDDLNTSDLTNVLLYNSFKDKKFNRYFRINGTFVKFPSGLNETNALATYVAKVDSSIYLRKDLQNGILESYTATDPQGIVAKRQADPLFVKSTELLMDDDFVNTKEFEPHVVDDEAMYVRLDTTEPTGMGLLWNDKGEIRRTQEVKFELEVTTLQPGKDADRYIPKIRALQSFTPKVYIIRNSVISFTIRSYSKVEKFRLIGEGITTVEVKKLGVDSLSNSFNGLHELTEFICPFEATANITNFYSAWEDCPKLHENTFPSIDVSSANQLSRAWFGTFTSINCPGTNGIVTVPAGAYTHDMCSPT